MAGTVAMNTIQGHVTHLTTKATNASTGISNTIVAYTNGDGKSIILPYCYQRSIVLPAFESDGITATNKTFVYYNRFRIKLNVTYSGNAIA